MTSSPHSLAEPVTLLFSRKSILIGTFLAGPLAASWMIRANLNSLGREREGDNVLLIGILYLGAILASIFLIPESIPDRLMNIIFPILTTGLAALGVDRLMGSELKSHKSNHFHSGWRVAAVSVVSVLLALLAIFLTASFMPVSYDHPAYSEGMMQFDANEQEAMGLYVILEEGNMEETRKAADQGIELWLKNIEIVNELNLLEDIPPELVEVNNLLIRYCQLRVQAYAVIAKSIDEDTPAYEWKINVLHQDIDEVLEALESAYIEL